MRQSAVTARSSVPALVAIAATCLLTTGRAQAQELPACEPTTPARETELILLSMAPGPEVWSVFGHNGLWVREPGRPDRIYNFGVVSTDHPGLLNRFMNATLDFRLGTRGEQSMREYYARQDRQVVAQRLSLPPGAARELIAYLAEEALPENRTYRYHWIDANCATRLRDALDQALDGQLAEQVVGMSGVSPRHEVLRHLGGYLPLWFGWHFAVGSSADAELTRWRWLFLPENLYRTMGEVSVTWPDGRVTPLVSDTCVVMAGEHDWVGPAAPRRALGSWLLGACLGLVALALGRARGRRPARWLLSLGMMGFGLIAGALGIGSLYLWLFSGYEGFWRNINLLVANPFSLLLVPAAVGLLFERVRWPRTARVVTSALAGLGVLALALAVVPGIPQPTLEATGLALPTLLAVWWVTRRATGGRSCSASR